MMAHNLCYTTLLDKTTVDRLGLVKDVDYTQTPNNGTLYQSLTVLVNFSSVPYRFVCQAIEEAWSLTDHFERLDFR